MRGVLADTNLRPWIDSTLEGTGTWELVSTQGGTDRWEVIAKGTSGSSAAELTDHFGKVCTTQGKWTSVQTAATGAPGETISRWTFNGRDGKPWNGTLTVTTVAAEPGTYSVKLIIARVG